MDSSIENAQFEDALEEVGNGGVRGARAAHSLLKAIALTRVASDANLMKHFLKKRERKAQAAHGRKPR